MNNIKKMFSTFLYKNYLKIMIKSVVYYCRAGKVRLYWVLE